MISELPAEAYREILSSSPDAAKIISGIAEIMPNGKAVVALGSIDTRLAKSLGPAVMDLLHEHTVTFDERQFSSFYHQFKTLMSLPRSEVQTVLEIGPGTGVLTTLLRHYGVSVKTMDISADRDPDIQGSVTDIPAADNSYDVVCAFEVLQHLPYDRFSPALAEMARCSRRSVVLSLPYAARRLSLNFSVDARIPFRGWRKIGFNIERTLPWRAGNRAPSPVDDFRAHHWEINRASYSQRRVLEDVSAAGLDVVGTFHNEHHPYHFFILCEPRAD